MEDKKNKSKHIEEDKNNFQTIKDPELRKKKWKEAKEQGKHIQDKNLQASVKNLIPLNERDPEEAREIRRKGALALNKLKGERKTAKQILNDLLPLYANVDAIVNNDTIPEDIKKEIIKKKIDVTQYDLIMMAQIYQAQQGNYKSAEFIRDTFGDKPITETHNINETITQADRDLIAKLSARMGINTDIIDVDTTED